MHNQHDNLWKTTTTTICITHHIHVKTSGGKVILKHVDVSHTLRVMLIK